MSKLRQYYQGAKAIVKIHAKDELVPLEMDEVNARISNCIGCQHNAEKSADLVDRLFSYTSKLDDAYKSNLEDRKKNIPGYDKLAKCHGCGGCTLKDKILLQPEDYREPILKNLITFNTLLRAKTGDGEPCWQIRSILTEEQLEEALKVGRVTESMLNKWGIK